MTVGGTSRTVLVTRAVEQGEATARHLRERGHIPVLAPLVRIERLPAHIDPGVQAILVTSRNGAASLAAATTERALPVLAVGEATAADLRAAGFADIRSADGDAEALGHLAARHLDPARGRVLHARGAEIRHSPLATLRRAGFDTAEAILYRTIPLTALPQEATACDTALVYSPGSARRLATVVPATLRLHVVGISEAAISPLYSLPFVASLHAAVHPSEVAMFDLLDALPKNPVAQGPDHR